MDYSDYWKNDWEKREKNRYYPRLYKHIKQRLTVPAGCKILDVGGGDGHFMHFLGLRKADIIDISDSGLEMAKKMGYETIKLNIERPFPIESESYDVIFCFEVLEHLNFPEVAISEINRVLKSDGVFYLGQPNVRADGDHHKKRYYLEDTIGILTKNSFRIEWLDFVPAFCMRDAIIEDILTTKSFFRKFKQSVALILSLLPWRLRYYMARAVPNRFALFFIAKATKTTNR